jgi:uncharacterized GH25 family protein
MKNIQIKKRIGLVGFTVMTLLLTGVFSAQAHFPWINLEDSSLSTGRNVKWTIGWGHRFPVAGLMNKSAVGEMFVIGPDGGKITAESVNELQFQSSEGLSAPGAYIVAVSRAAGFYTKTTEGSKRQSKKGLENVLSCSYSNSYMKAIANVGGEAGPVDAPAGHEMEIIPLVNPATLKVGDFLPFKAVLKGKPYKGDFSATYAGFSPENNVFAYSSSTNAEGHGKIKILSSGAWLITMTVKEPFADPEECDVQSFRASLTFDVL